MARSKLTDEMIEILVHLKGKGLTDKAVCEGAGISLALLQNWIRLGKNAMVAGRENKYLVFLKLYQQAETECKLGLLDLVKKEASAGSWSASAWLLERCYPQEYGRKALELTGKDGGPIQTASAVDVSVDLQKLSDEDLLALEQMALKIARHQQEEEAQLEEMGLG